MPYIGTKRAERIRNDLQDVTNVGDLTYVLTEEAVKYVEAHGLSYQVISEVRAGLYGTLREFDRRVADPYEDSVRGGTAATLPLAPSDEERADPYRRLDRIVAERNRAISRRAERMLHRDE